MAPVHLRIRFDYLPIHRAVTWEILRQEAQACDPGSAYRTNPPPGPPPPS